jgi:DnaJ-class molecular chaperone
MQKFIDCPECDGDGRVELEDWVPKSSTWHGDFEGKMYDCENCNGSGQIEPLETEEDL